MTERPILMSSPMVLALLDGTKTQTRRTMKLRPMSWAERFVLAPFKGYGRLGEWIQMTIDENRQAGLGKCPYGKVGDRLWVKETFHYDADHNRTFYRTDADETTGREVPYLMDGAGGYGAGVGHAIIKRWTPSIFMSRCVSRITLEITDVRVQRLRDITEADAEAEGIKFRGVDGLAFWHDYSRPDDSESVFSSPVDSYHTLWESINGPGSWMKNPWVWCVSFWRVKP